MSKIPTYRGTSGFVSLVVKKHIKYLVIFFRVFRPDVESRPIGISGNVGISGLKILY